MVQEPLFPKLRGRLELKEEWGKNKIWGPTALKLKGTP